jgi:hypothetical protein
MTTEPRLDLETVLARVAEVLKSRVLSINGRAGHVKLRAKDVGLGHVDDTSDHLKPISQPTLNALAAKADRSELEALRDALAAYTPALPPDVHRAQLNLGDAATRNVGTGDNDVAGALEVQTLARTITRLEQRITDLENRP